MMKRRKLADSLKMPAFKGSVDDIPCQYADFVQIYDSEYNIWLERFK